MSAQSRTRRSPRVHRLAEDIPTGEQQRLRWAATLTPPTHPHPAYQLLGAGTQRLRLTGAGAQPPGLLCTEAQRNHGC